MQRSTLTKIRIPGMVICALLYLFASHPSLRAQAPTQVSGQTDQEGRCTGIVKDKSGEVIIGATIKVKGTQNGTSSRTDGSFTLNGVKKGSIIVATFIGYAATETVWNGKPLTIVLQDESQQLGEVVVTALGLSKQAKSVGYATTRVSTAEIERASIISPVNALQGKVAGVQINIGGASGLTSSSAITIRGAKSIGKNNSPIFVIDGMIIQEAITGALNGTDWGSQLKNLNPADYESVTVLKGAAATALYGSRGANGAVVIVTKGGQYGKKGLGIEVNQSIEFTDVYKSPIELQDIYGAGSVFNGYEGDIGPDGLAKTTQSWGPKMDGHMLNQFLPDGKDTPFSPHPTNWKAFYKTGLNTTTNIAISGGAEKSNFRLSYGYTDNTGVFIRNTFKRHNIGFKGLADLNRIFSAEIGVKYGFSEGLNGASQGGWDWGNNVGMMTAYYLPRNYDVSAHMSQYRDPVTHKVLGTGLSPALDGYLHTRDTRVDRRSEQSLLTDFTLRARLLSWLNASLKANYNYYSYGNETQEYGTGEYYGPSKSGMYARSGDTMGNYNFLGMLQSPDNSFSIAGQPLTFSAILAAELYGNTAHSSWRKSTKGGLIVPAVFSFSNSAEKIEPEAYHTPRNQQTLGISAIANLGWKDQLFLELTARNDWLSSLTYPSYITTGMNNYSVFYPSANASWVFTDTFRETIPSWFSFGKLRASIARVGMGTSAYATAEGYGIYKQSSIYTPDRKESVLMAYPNLGTAFNDNLKPEIQQSIEIGTDLRFFDERLSLDIAYYKTNTFNQIMKIGSVIEAGAGSRMINAGNIQNQGIEIQLDATPIRTSDWRWSLGGNFTLNRGKIIALDPDAKEWQLFGGYDAAPEIRAYEGGAFGVFTSYLNGSIMSPIATFQGKEGDPRNGKMLIKYSQEFGKPNGVSIYSPVTLYDRNEPGDRDRHILGKVEPDFILSLNTTLSFKDFDLYIQGDGRFGGNMFSNLWKYSVPKGSLKSTLVGRDRDHGGIARINYKGETVYNGLMLDAVFAEGAKAPTEKPDGSLGPMVDVGGLTYEEAIRTKHIRPTLTGAWYAGNYGWGMPAMPEAIQDNTWFCLREITLGYRLPEAWCARIGANYLRLGVTARNVAYLLNRLNDGLNPASVSSNNPLIPMDIGGVPFFRTYSANVTIRF